MLFLVKPRLADHFADRFADQFADQDAGLRTNLRTSLRTNSKTTTHIGPFLFCRAVAPFMPARPPGDLYLYPGARPVHRMGKARGLCSAGRCFCGACFVGLPVVSPEILMLPAFA